MSIEDYKFSDSEVGGCRIIGDEIYIDDDDYDMSAISINKHDVIALAKHFKLNAHDVQCSEHIALQKHCQELEDNIEALESSSNNRSKDMQ